MSRHGAFAFALAAGIGVVGCQPAVTVVKVDPASIGGEQRLSTNRCNFRLKAVLDARGDASDSGGLDLNRIELTNALDLVRIELLKSGLLAPSAPQGRDVEVSLRRVYMAQNRYTRVAVVVYSVKAEGLSDFLVRAQPAHINYWGGGGEAAVAAIASALHSANEQLMDSLNKVCKV